MKITDIKKQVKTAGRYSIFVDSKFAFGLSDSALLDSGIKIGQDISNKELIKLKNISSEDKTYSMVLNLIVRRPRSEWEIREYLKRKKYDPEKVDNLINKLYDQSWLNDEDFARKWVENRRLLKSISRRKLITELKSKRIDNETIEKIMSEDAVDEKEIIRRVIVVKSRQTKYQDKQKLLAYLMRQGYNYSDVMEVLNIELTD